MLHYALVFLVAGLIAGALYVAGISVVAVQISWILLLIGTALIVIHLAMGRPVRVTRPDEAVSRHDAVTPPR